MIGSQTAGNGITTHVCKKWGSNNKSRWMPPRGSRSAVHKAYKNLQFSITLYRCFVNIYFKIILPLENNILLFAVFFSYYSPFGMIAQNVFEVSFFRIIPFEDYTTNL